MSEVRDEQLTRWWLENEWDDTVHAGVNVRRFRTWFLAQGEDDE